MTASWYQRVVRPERTYKLTCGGWVRSCGRVFSYTDVKRSQEYYQRQHILCDQCEDSRRRLLCFPEV